MAAVSESLIFLSLLRKSCMALLSILRYPDPRLHKLAKPVTDFDDRLKQLIADMAETMYEAPGIGLAATQVDVHQQVIVIDTLGTVSVKDSLFGTSDHYRKMAYIPIEGVQDSMFKISSEIINKNGYNVPVFEVRVSKDAILFDQNKDLLKQEKALMSVDGVNGPDLVLGSMTDVSTNGNWPTTYDAIARN